MFWCAFWVLFLACLLGGLFCVCSLFGWLRVWFGLGVCFGDLFCLLGFFLSSDIEAN